jgi:hypothetical protein
MNRSTISIACILATCACTDGSYALTIVTSDPQALAKGVGYELFVLRSACPTDLNPDRTVDSSTIVHRFEWTATGTTAASDAPQIGQLNGGRYGFLARVRRPDDCAVHWSGCLDFSIRDRGSGPIDLLLLRVNGKGCDDGLACNGRETCGPGFSCAPGMPVSCSSTVSCAVGHCSEPAGTCSYLPDHRKCAQGEVCDPASGCINTRTCTTSAACDDGVFCNGMETCDMNGQCQPGMPPSCDDGIPCTLDSCDPSQNACAHVPDDSMCPAMGLCSVGACMAGTGCTLVARSCDDGDPCTDDACQEGTGCIHTVRDQDGDGFDCHNDCDDTNPAIHPGAQEICNGIDDNCNGLIDEGGVCDGLDGGFLDADVTDSA